jgi:hypothetical protein
MPVITRIAVMAIGRFVVTPPVMAAIVIAISAVTPPVMAIGRFIVTPPVMAAIVMATPVVTLAIIAMPALAIVTIWTTCLTICRRSNQLYDSGKRNSRDNKDYLFHFFLLTTVPCFSLRPRDTGDWVRFFRIVPTLIISYLQCLRQYFSDHIVTSCFYKAKFLSQCIAINRNTPDLSKIHHDLRFNFLVGP